MKIQTHFGSCYVHVALLITWLKAVTPLWHLMNCKGPLYLKFEWQMALYDLNISHNCTNLIVILRPSDNVKCSRYPLLPLNRLPIIITQSTHIFYTVITLSFYKMIVEICSPHDFCTMLNICSEFCGGKVCGWKPERVQGFRGNTTRIIRGRYTTVGKVIHWNTTTS